MGLFDIFSGAPMQDAAAKNALLYQQYGQEAQNAINAGERNAASQFGNAVSAYAPLSSLAGRYSGLTNLYSDALGARGPQGNAAAVAAFQAGPGYQWAVNQGTDAVARKAASLGLAASGNTMDEIRQRAQNAANQEYGSWLDRLAGFVQPELSATGNVASGTSGAYQGLGGMYNANSLGRANVFGNMASGQAQSNTAAANAQQQGSAAFWNALAALGGGVGKALLA